MLDDVTDADALLRAVEMSFVLDHVLARINPEVTSSVVDVVVLYIVAVVVVVVIVVVIVVAVVFVELVVLQHFETMSCGQDPTVVNNGAAAMVVMTHQADAHLMRERGRGESETESGKGYNDEGTVATRVAKLRHGASM